MLGVEFRDTVATWTHLVWFVLAIPATRFLWIRSRGDLPKQIALLIFGLSMVFCFGGSALFHAVRLSRHQVKIFETIDYIGIFLFMAGSCTPIAFTLIQRPWRWPVLRLAWSLAAAGMVLRLFFPDAPHWLYTLIFFLLGWGLVLVYYELVKGVPKRALRPIVIGGLLYTTGAALNVLRWPTIWTGLIAFHEVFHLFVMAGSLVHYGFMLDVVVPYPRTRTDREMEIAESQDDYGVAEMGQAGG
jgi:hemolysin III